MNINAVCYSNKKRALLKSQTVKLLLEKNYHVHPTVFIYICTFVPRPSGILWGRETMLKHVSKTCTLFNGHLRLNAKMT